MSVSMQVCLELRVELSRSIHSRCAASDMVVAVQKLCSFAWQGDAAVHRDGSHSPYECMCCRSDCRLL